MEVLMAVSTAFGWWDHDYHKRILIMRRVDGKIGGGKWNLPGGKVERGENLSEAASREAMEESGIDALPTRIGQVFSNITGEGNLFVFMIFEYPMPPTHEEPKVTLNGEHTEYKWATELELRHELANECLPRLKAYILGEQSAANGIWHRDVTEYPWYKGEDPWVGIPKE